MHSSVSTSARFLPLLVAHVQCTDACNTAAEVFLLYVFTHEAHRRTGGVKIQSRNGDIFIKNRILINYSACVKGAWLTDVLNPRLLACFWADLRVEPEVDEPQHVTHVSFFLLSLFFLFFLRQLHVCLFTQGMCSCSESWSWLIGAFRLAEREKHRNIKYEIEMALACFPFEPKLRSAAATFKRQTQILTYKSFKKSDMICYDTETRYTNSQTSVFAD